MPSQSARSVCRYHSRVRNESPSPAKQSLTPLQEFPLNEKLFPPHTRSRHNFLVASPTRGGDPPGERLWRILDLALAREGEKRDVCSVEPN